MSGTSFGSGLRNKIAYHPQINSDRFKNVFFNKFIFKYALLFIYLSIYFWIVYFLKF